MTTQLENLLGILHFDRTKKKFLESVRTPGTYTPEHIEATDKLLSMEENWSFIRKENLLIIREEILPAKEAGDNKRYIQMAKKSIDLNLKDNYDAIIMNDVIKWGDSELADYAIEQMISKLEKNKEPKQYSFRPIIGIAESFGKQEVATQYLERLLTIQEKDTEDHFSAADTLQKLGRFNEAIDRYVEIAKGDYPSFIKDALSVAEEHVPERVKEIAQKGFDSFDTNNLSWESYIKCAEKIGKTKEAKKTAIEYAQEVQIENSPGFYNNLVKSLMKFEKKDEAKGLVLKVAKSQEVAKNSNNYNYYCYEEAKEMAGLYNNIGETNFVKDIYDKRIDALIENGHNAIDIENEIKNVIKLTGDLNFREKKLELYAREGEFRKASTLATKLGNYKLAESYETMNQMAELATAQSSK